MRARFASYPPGTGYREREAGERKRRVAATQSLQNLAAFEPRALACMHGSAFAGDGRSTLLALAKALES